MYQSKENSWIRDLELLSLTSLSAKQLYCRSSRGCTPLDVRRKQQTCSGCLSHRLSTIKAFTSVLAQRFCNCCDSSSLRSSEWCNCVSIRGTCWWAVYSRWSHYKWSPFALLHPSLVLLKRDSLVDRTAFTLGRKARSMCWWEESAWEDSGLFVRLRFSDWLFLRHPVCSTNRFSDSMFLRRLFVRLYYNYAYHYLSSSWSRLWSPT